MRAGMGLEELMLDRALPASRLPTALGERRQERLQASQAIHSHGLIAAGKDFWLRVIRGLARLIEAGGPMS